jgi:hypothetical protein
VFAFEESENLYYADVEVFTTEVDEITDRSL